MKLTPQEFDWITAVCDAEGWELIEDTSLFIIADVDPFTVAMRLVEHVVDISSSAYLNKGNIRDYINKLATVKVTTKEENGEKEIRFHKLTQEKS